MEMNYFAGEHMLITGGSRGIGLATAEAFARCGASVTICGVDREHLAQAKKRLSDITENVAALPCDVGDAEQLDELAKTSYQNFGPIYAWINNAGFMPAAALADTDPRLLERVFRVNVQPVCQSARLAKSYLKTGGVILNASSFTARMPSVNYGAYAAAKAAVASLTRSMAAELAPLSIRVAGYMPGLIDTELSRDSIEKFGEKLMDPIPLRRCGSAAEIAAGLLFLASPAASYVNGVCLELSGGKYAVQNPWVAWSK